jgi:hypothetical protein
MVAEPCEGVWTRGGIQSSASGYCTIYHRMARRVLTGGVIDLTCADLNRTRSGECA